MTWLDELKVGDKVIEGMSILPVTAIHKLHIVCGRNKYRKYNGRAVGSSTWNAWYIHEATPEAIEDIRILIDHNRLIKAI